MTAAFVPGRAYPSVSLTGGACGLMCPMCMGRWLRGMAWATTPEDLSALMRRLWSTGSRGILLSGGFDAGGRLPLRPFLRAVREVKREVDMFVSVHPGMVDRETAEEMADAGIDMVDFEVLPSRRTAERSKGLRYGLEDYLRALEILLEFGPPHVAPHLTVGLPGSGLDEWVEAARQIRAAGADRLVVLAFVPTAGTPLAGHPPPTPGEVAAAVGAARGIFREVYLGCMRSPRLKVRYDEAAVGAGVDRVANPRRETISRFGMRVVGACCAVPEGELWRFPSYPTTDASLPVSPLLNLSMEKPSIGRSRGSPDIS